MVHVATHAAIAQHQSFNKKPAAVMALVETCATPVDKL